MTGLTRRGVLIGAGAAITAGTAASVLACRPDNVQVAGLDFVRLRGVLTDIHASDRVGNAYRRGKDSEALLAEFAAKPGLSEVAAHTCSEAARAALQAQAREDFRCGDVVVTDRLVMARSECIIAALVA